MNQCWINENIDFYIYDLPMSFAIFYINAPYMKNITLTYLCKNKWNMSQFTGFSEDDLERIKSGETADESKNSTYGV